MTKITRSAVPLLLILSGAMLAVLVPGGPIETRNFSHIDPLILGAFNTFLTVLGIGSIFIAFFAYKARRTAFMPSALCGLGYFLVYILDLFRIFPVSPDPMPPALWGIETAGTIVSLPLMAAATWAALGVTSENDNETTLSSTKRTMWLGVPVALIALAIIVFATRAAMHGG